MAILEKEVEIICTGSNIRYYKDLGYDADRLKKIKVLVNHLSYGSGVVVTKICDDCGEITENLLYKDVIRRRQTVGDGKDRCFKCGAKVHETKKKKNIKYEKSLEYYAVKSDMAFLLEEFSPNNNKKASEISYGTNDEYLWKCQKCNREYSRSIKTRTYRNHGCTYCPVSNGEKRISDIFITFSNIKYIPQCRFKNCKDKVRLPFDFAIYNRCKELILLVEFDGRQHFSPIEWFGGEKELRQAIKRDNIKNNYCINNNISLIRIPYWDYENIENILQHVLGYYNLIDKKDVDQELVHQYLVNHPDWSHEKYISQAI